MKEQAKPYALAGNRAKRGNETLLIASDLPERALMVP
jgi:hypothetical protein